MVTNGDNLRIYLFRGATRSDVLLVTTARERLHDDWDAVAKAFGRPAAVAHKRKAEL